MAWTTPTVRATGDLITATIWNADVVNNLLYLGLGAAVASSPPGSPVRYQRWIWAPGIGYGIHWSMIYRDDLDGTYPWHCLGGPFWSNTGSASGSASGGFTALSGAFSVSRAGYYEAECDVTGTWTGSGAQAQSGLMAAGTVQISQGFQGSERASYRYQGLVAAGSTIAMAGDTSPATWAYNGSLWVRPVKVA